jgi:VWFA-related protein
MRQAITYLALAAAFVPVQDQRQTVRTSTAGVLVDVTVVDKDGHPVTDLHAADFEIKEDGKPQRIITATLMRGGVPARISEASAAPGAAAVSPQAAEAAATGSAAAPIPTITAILFDGLSPDTRPFATRAAAQFVSSLTTPSQYAGVFMTGLALTTMQPFTNNTADLRSAINQVALTAADNLSPEAERKRSSARTTGLDTETPVTAGAEYGQGWVNVAERERRLYGASLDPSEQMLTRLEQRMKEGYQHFLGEMEGDASLTGLRAAVSGLAPLPGRKSLLYFTEALPVTSRLRSRFEALIGEANRANITIYPVDAAGLRVNSKEMEVNQGVSVAGSQGLGDAQRPDGAWTKELERQSEALSSGPSAVLGRLAEETGGFLIDNTNNLGKGIARMYVDRTTYYLLGYEPTNSAADGTFRKVSVKVKRGKYTIRARRGYSAPTAPR